MKYELRFLGEIRFGPTYYQLYINGFKVRDFICGDTYVELDGGRYLAIQEWLNTNETKGAITRAAIFDFEKRVVAKLKIVESGFAEKFQLDKNIFIYSELRWLSQHTEVRVDWDSIDTWQPIPLESTFYRIGNALRKYTK